MLKLIDSSQTFSSFTNTKCAEVLYQTQETFSIVCTFCELKSFDFTDFLLHFRNEHLNQTLIKKVEENTEVETTDDVYRAEVAFEYAPKNSPSQSPMNSMEDEKDFAQFANSTAPSTLRKIEEFSEASDFASDTDDEDYVPLIKIINNASQKQPKQSTSAPQELHRCECGKPYKTKKTLEQHIKKCHSTEAHELKCPRCDSFFGEERLLNAHFRKAHEGFPCSDCEKVYKTREALSIHKLNHTGVRSFVCDFENCGKAFFNRKILYSHKRGVHLAQPNYICEVCGYRTKIKSALAVHKRSHTGEKPFTCDICGKGFVSPSLLSDHKPIHSKERPYHCEVCGASFSRPKALYHHKHLHLGIKKFVCKLCGKAYAQAAGLCGHMRQHRSQFI